MHGQVGPLKCAVQALLRFALEAARWRPWRARLRHDLTRLLQVPSSVAGGIPVLWQCAAVGSRAVAVPGNQRASDNPQPVLAAARVAELMRPPITMMTPMVSGHEMDTLSAGFHAVSSGVSTR